MPRARGRSFRLQRAYGLAFSPDSKAVATISRDVMLWDTAARRKVFSVHPLSHPSHLDFSPDSAQLAVKSTSGRIVVLDASSGQTASDCGNDKEGEGARLFYTADGEAIVDASWGGIISVRQANTCEIIWQEQLPGMVSGFTATADRRTFAYTVSRVPPSETEQPPEDLMFYRRWPFSRFSAVQLPFTRRFTRRIALSPSGQRVAVLHGAPPNTLEILATDRSKPLLSCQVDLGVSVSSLSWSPDESVLVCVESHIVSFFEAATLRRTHSVPLQYPAPACFSPDGRLVGFASWTRAKILDLADLETYRVAAHGP